MDFVESNQMAAPAAQSMDEHHIVSLIVTVAGLGAGALTQDPRSLVKYAG